MDRAETVVTAPRPIPTTFIFLAAFAIHAPAASDEASVKVVRHEFPHLFRVALSAPLVRAMEPKVVCRFFADHVSAAGATVAGAGFVYHRARHGLHAGAVRGDPALGAGCVSFFFAVGGPARGVACRAGQRFSWFGSLSGVFRRPAVHYVRGAALPECAAVSVPVGAPRKLAILS